MQLDLVSDGAQEQRKIVLVAARGERFGQVGRRRARGLLKAFVRQWIEVGFGERKNELIADPNREAALPAHGERKHRDRIAADFGRERLEARSGAPHPSRWIGAEDCGPERNDVPILECQLLWLGDRHCERWRWRIGRLARGRRGARASKREGRGENHDTTTGRFHACLRCALHIRWLNKTRAE